MPKYIMVSFLVCKVAIIEAFKTWLKAHVSSTLFVFTGLVSLPASTLL